MALSIFKVKIDHCLLIKTVSSQLKTIVFEAKIFHGQEMCFKGTYLYRNVFQFTFCAALPPDGRPKSKELVGLTHRGLEANNIMLILI